MNSLEFQKKLSDAWLELITKRKEDQNFIEKQAGIKAHDKYWFTLDQKNLPGVIINLDQDIEFNIANFPKAKGWVFNKV